MNNQCFYVKIKRTIFISQFCMHENCYIKQFDNFFILGYEYESQNWDSEDIPATERDLAEDAPWKQIQVIHFNHAWLFGFFEMSLGSSQERSKSINLI